MSNQKNNADQHKAFYEALKSYGYIFPETEEDLEKFEISILKMKFSIPDNLNDPGRILTEGRIEKSSQFNLFYDEQVEENLAQAAREGSDISSDVWEQMEKDRKRAEEADDEENEID